MATHRVQMNIPRGIPVVNTDVDFTIKSNGTKLGTLKVSKGAVEWLPANNSIHSFTMTWEQFAQTMEDNGRERRRSQ